jgi:REP element-mobilizing transposase RayT
MKLELYQEVILIRDVPDENLHEGDVATLVDYVPHPAGEEEAAVLELFNAVGESIGMATVPASAVSPLPAYPITTDLENRSTPFQIGEKKGNLEYKLFYSKTLPHIQPPGATLFVTYRLAGSIPQAVIQQLWVERQAMERHIAAIADPMQRSLEQIVLNKKLFARWDRVLDRAESGPMWLKEPAVAQIVVESLHFLDGDKYALDCFCVMSNHAHVLFTPLEKAEGTYVALPRIMHSLKGFTAVSANGVLGRTGAFWEHESYDHVVRDEAELNRIRRYVLYNPVKAGLVAAPEDWPWSWASWL